MKKKVFIFGGIVAILDQLIKLLVVNTLIGKGSIDVINNFFYLTYVENTGAAWGIFSGSRWFLVILSILAIYAILKYFLLDLNITKIEFVAYSLLLGGIIGNLIDRIVYGYVIDFMDFRFGSYDFPVFNLADSCIVIGAFLIIFHLIKNVFKQEKTK